MKKGFIVIISLISVLFLMGAKDFEQVSKSLSGLEEFLSSWSTSMEGLEDKVAVLEERMAEETQAKKDILKSLSSIENHLAEMNVRLKSVEKLPTFFSEMPTETLGKTLRFYNETIADLKKQIENQQVITAVLEKKYQEAQRPLEPVKKEIEEVRKQVVDLSQKADQNALTIEGVQKNLESSIVESVTVTLQEYEKIFMTLAQRIESLEEHAGVTTTVEVAETEEEPEAVEHEGAEHGEHVGHGEHAGHGEVAEAEEAAPAVPEKTPEEEGFQDIGSGFYVKNITFEPFGSSTTLIGDMKNHTNKDYSIAEFTIKVYNPDDLLLGSDDFSIKGFKKGEVKTFKQIITGVRPKKIIYYSINFKKPY
jgi:predicted  nucleic acid-binding Zn-ribbon protein